MRGSVTKKSLSKFAAKQVLSSSSSSSNDSSTSSSSDSDDELGAGSESEDKKPQSGRCYFSVHTEVIGIGVDNLL